MTIRPAIPADVMAILALIEDAQPRSKYADDGEIDRDYTRQMFTRAMHFSKNTHHQGTLFLVSEKDGKIEGYFFGFLDRVYLIGKPLCASEVHFYLSPQADQRDAIRIVNAFIEWGESNPKVIEFKIGESNVFGDPDPRFAELLKRKGFAPSATVFTKRIAK